MKSRIPWNKGIHLSDEYKEKLSKSGKGKQSGNKHPNWQGGKSFEPYCFKFNKQLKDKIRNRDNYQCQFTGCLLSQLESLILYKQPLHIHHIHYDKENCETDLITLCVKHNVIVNTNRNYWKNIL